jgi:hypothetical protein
MPYRAIANSRPSALFSDDPGEIVGKDARQGRQIAGAVVHGPREFADGLLAFGH